MGVRGLRRQKMHSRCTMSPPRPSTRSELYTLYPYLNVLYKTMQTGAEQMRKKCKKDVQECGKGAEEMQELRKW